MLLLSRQIADPALGWKLRKDLFKQVDMLVPSTPGQKVLFWLRVPMKSRGIMNQAAMLAVAAKYNLSYTYVVENPFVLCQCAWNFFVWLCILCFPRMVKLSCVLHVYCPYCA